MTSYEFYITPNEYEAAAQNGVCAKTLNKRVRDSAWKKIDAIQKPPRETTDRRKWTALAEQNGIGYAAFMSRVNHYGWDDDRAATQPLASPEEKRAAALHAAEATRKIPKEFVEMAKNNGIPYATFHYRYKAGWGLERAATQPLMTPEEKGRLGWQKVNQLYGNINSLIKRR